MLRSSYKQNLHCYWGPVLIFTCAYNKIFNIVTQGNVTVFFISTWKIKHIEAPDLEKLSTQSMYVFLAPENKHIYLHFRPILLVKNNK